MKLEEFDYDLPPSRIAQFPPSERGESRLMVIDRKSGSIEHRAFREMIEYLRGGDLLVINNTRVLLARLIGRKKMGGKCEILLIPQWNGARNNWRALIKGVKKDAKGLRIFFEGGLEAEVADVRDGKATIRFDGQNEVADILQKFGHVPLPPYIKRQDEFPDRSRYQTVFAEKDGSIAAPTAGLHFTEEMLHSVRENGVGIVSITLHIGPGTFTPVKTEDIEDHPMEAEWTEVPHETAQQIERTKREGGRVIAVGTTTTRALESSCGPEGQVKTGERFSSLFIHPPYRFRVIDGLITNFHLPKSTLIMLVSAFAGKDLLMRAYQEAVKHEYRFYSYGDAMLIL